MNPKDVDEQFRDIVSHLADTSSKHPRGFGKKADDPYYYTAEGYRFLKTASAYYAVVFAVGMTLVVAGVPFRSVIIGVAGFLTALWGLLKFLDIREKYVTVRRYRQEGGPVPNHNSEFQQ